MNDNMTDDQLINYCDSHRQTPRALFSRSQVVRMGQLANIELDDNLPEWIPVKDDMEELVKAARARRGQH